MSETTKPYDPWEWTEDDERFFLDLYDGAPRTMAIRDICTRMIREHRVRVRDRVEAYQAAGTPKPAAEPTWVKIGDVAVPTVRIIKFKRYPSGVVVRVDGDSFDVYGSDADALWSHVTHPVRCIDLTPRKDGNA